MEKEHREVWFDNDLQIEAYQLHGIVQKFPNHFHPYYVIGFIEGGKRQMWCRHKEYVCEKGDMILFNPLDNHHCAPLDDSILDYRAVNIQPEVMQTIMEELFQTKQLPHFTTPLIKNCEYTQQLSSLYQAIMEQACTLEKEEALYFLMQPLMENYMEIEKEDAPLEEPIQKLCAYMEEHYGENITLQTLSELSHFSKSYLLNAFTRQTGVSCYRYLQTVRIHQAKKMLEKGLSLKDAAMAAGFSDQSHFTNFFKMFIGLTPKQYQRIFLKGAMHDE